MPRPDVEPGVAVEDGPLRSIAADAPSVSRLIDPARRWASMMADRSWQTPELLDRARALIDLKVRTGLTRLNAGPDPLPALRAAFGARRLILVVDRGADDPAFGAPLPPADSRDRLLRLAGEQHPDAGVVLMSGDGAGVIGPDADVAPLLSAVDAVYAPGGYVGFEAVLRGLPVTCIGEPFYGGLGLTQDLTPRGAQSPMSREALFAAACLLAPDYVDPLDGAPCTAEVAFERLAAMRAHARRVAGRWVGLNIAPAKDRILEAFLAGPCSDFRPRSMAPPPAGARLAVWASGSSPAVRRAVRDRPDQVVRIEDGFLRSVGLGADFHPAGSLVLDRRGVHYDHRNRSELDDLIDEASASPALQDRARRLIDRIVALGLTKYNLGGGPVAAVSGGRRTVLVPGQVADDASVRTGGGGMDMASLLTRVREAEPGARILYRPHPDVIAGLRPGDQLPGAEADDIVAGGDILEAMAAVDEVHVLTSQAGFEALLRGKPVTTHGWPFYAGRGLTRDLGSGPAPQREPATLEAVAAGALILYPLYLDPVSRKPCSPETFVERLAAARDAPAKDGGWRYLRALRHMRKRPRPVY